MQEFTPNLEDAYRQYRGLLFSALGKLAAQGFATPPSDATDLVHDFFVEVWDGITERYQPNKADLGTYVYAAFVQFARPRIVRLRRFHGSLIEPKKLECFIENESEKAEPKDDLDLQKLRNAINALPSPNREILECWLNESSESERAVSRTFGLSRYQTRLRLIDALGQVAVEMDALRNISNIDRNVALAVWRDGLTIAEASARLCLTIQKISNAYRRNQDRLEQCLSFIHSTQKHKTRGTAMSKTKAEKLLERIYTEFYSDSLLQEIKSNAVELAEYLRETEGSHLSSTKSLPEKWLSEVYTALAEGLMAEAESIPEEEFLIAYSKDRESVGHAFSEVLVPAIPKGTSRLVELCKSKLRQVSQRIQKLLANEPDVRAGGPAAAELAAFGFTPTHLVLATDAVALLLERAINAGFFPVDRLLLIQLSANRPYKITCQGLENEISQLGLVDEIAAFAEVDNKRGEVLLQWSVETAEFVPYLFVGFLANLEKNTLVLKQLTSSETPANLFERWNSHNNIIEYQDMPVMSGRSY